MENQIFELQYAINTFYFLVCGAFVMWMASGFAMLEAGLVRSKNTTEILAKNVGLFAISCTMFLFIGYQIMYQGGFFLSSLTEIDDSLINDTLAKSAENGFHGSATYSLASDFFFQVVFVATSMSIVSGVVAERMKLWTFFAFAIVMTGLIYPIEGSWVWGTQGMFGINLSENFNFSDFAGSGVVHMAGASSALAGVLLLGARKGKYSKNGINAIPGANMPLATLGTFILWLGWFGFNGGSVLKLSDITSAYSVSLVFVNTNAAACGGAIGALLISRIIFKKADLTMLLNGVLAGLVAITAEPLNPTPLLASIFGILAGVIVVYSIVAFDKLKIDDPVGALSVHGVVGLYGLLIVPITNSEATFLGQLIGAFIIFLWVFVTSFIVWKILDKVMGLRISDEHEYDGADIHECGIEAYPEFVK